ncbi:sensor histidine kinase [Limnohabitans sp. DM1]|uniref:sensor histidine kinase n=1 Tax=Limnohabitans sp. DM1 TaxID=1597955 RepID=UPI000A498F25|nr:ATP-binding protein [Limnohabitans sp. DM1]
MTDLKNEGRDEEAIRQNNWENKTINIASVIHDEICPMLTYMLHDMYWIEKFSECSTVKTRANQCIDQLTNAMNRCRTILLDLPPNDEGPSLTESLDCMISNFKKISDITVSSEIDHLINQLGGEQQSVIYRSLQEALSNVSKHSHAKHVHVTAKIMLHQVQVRVEDDGIGLGSGDLSPAFCIGLKMQKQRAEDLAGHFCIQNNSNGVGTKIHLSFPIDSNLIYL